MTDLIAEQNRARRPAPILALREAPGHLIRRAQQRHTMLWGREFNGNLTGPQYAVISVIGGDDGLDQRTVGKWASLDKSSTADIVARLQGQGWLRFSRDPVDGRRKTLSLNPLARAALGDITRRVELVQQRLLEPVPAESLDAFLDMLRLVAYGGALASFERAPSSVLTLRDTPGHLIRRAQQLHTVAWGAEVGRTPTAPQYAVLSALWGHPDGIEQSSGADLASLDRASMADVVQRLVKAGWVARTRNPEDIRRRLLCLTDSIRHDMVQLTPAVQRVQARLMAPLADAMQRETFLQGCRALAYPGERAGSAIEPYRLS